MLDFNLYFKLGIDHILTWEAMDHILFVAALCLRYTWKDWRKVAVLVTAFTIGHSITLALSTLGILHMNTKWIEFLIPITIICTAINNLLQKPGATKKKLPLIYFFALFFGMIHGMAYATTLLSLEGTEGLVAHLFAFNLGIEVAQLLVVAVVLALSHLVVNIIKLPAQRWLQIISIIILIFSCKMAFERLPELYLKAA
ncbi:HupE/UreJ family protein [Pinibacter soli]|uniref:HupE/UreJ family protein n=1 Tax=Pinibacter soli TaxID=3044211 RepID=A0ABT6RES2_9BACT|nr:HupE/UreJ family protein [Pinibacter soli]MDI3321065.1 HupE/UreJ family protein [Pinibacter soli]